MIEYRRATPSDAAGVVRLMSDPQVFAGLMQTPYPGLDSWRKRLEQQIEQQDGLHLLAIETGEVIASAGIHGTGSCCAAATPPASESAWHTSGRARGWGPR